MLRRGTPNISYHLIDDICGFLVNKWTKPLLGDLNLAKIVENEDILIDGSKRRVAEKYRKYILLKVD